MTSITFEHVIMYGVLELDTGMDTSIYLQTFPKIISRSHKTTVSCLCAYVEAYAAAVGGQLGCLGGISLPIVWREEEAGSARGRFVCIL